VGTLLVKPKRHVTRVSDLDRAEAAQQGPLLQQAAKVIDDLIAPDQIYVCLWSHAGGEPVHIHYVVQPVTRAQMDGHDTYGPRLQVELFAAGEIPDPDSVEAFAVRAREAFTQRQ
jgi:diadenosine tetraphosphate (Ap4A) HIT family hydrolase